MLPYGLPADKDLTVDYLKAYVGEEEDEDYANYKYKPPFELYEKYYAEWKQYILQSKTDHDLLLLPLSNILLRTLDEYLDNSPNKVCHGKDIPTTTKYESIEDGPIVVLDGDRYFSLKEQKTLFFESFITPTRSHMSSCWRQWLIVYPDNNNDSICCRFCLWTRNGSYLPSPESINCHMSSPFLADIKRMRKDGTKLALRRFAITSPSSPPWASIIMAIDKNRGYLVYAGGVHREHPDCWIVLDSITNYATGDLLYFTKEASFYILPDAQSGHLEVWSVQDRLLSKTTEMSAELFNNNNSNYHYIHGYLVESLNGNLLLVRRYVMKNNDNSFKTNSFEVFKLNFRLKHWEVVASLDNNEALFVGSNGSFALSSTKYPEVISNCIYFTDQHNRTHDKDNGIFHFNDSTVTPLFNGEQSYQAPTWLCPSDEWWTEHYRDPSRFGYIREY